jgi:hypothetical protein
MNFLIAIALLRFTSDVSLTEFYTSGRDLVKYGTPMSNIRLRETTMSLSGRRTGDIERREPQRQPLNDQSPIDRKGL